MLAKLETICAIRKEIMDYFGYVDFETENSHYYFANG
jgi:hypothetical protein